MRRKEFVMRMMLGKFEVGVLTVLAFGCGAAAMRATSPGTARAEAAAVRSSDFPPAEVAVASVDTLQSVVVPRTNGTALKIATTTNTPSFRLEFGSFATQVPLQHAGTTLNCGAASFHLTTGTRGGSCIVDAAGGSATCTDGDNSVTAKCPTGCGNSSGAGDCTQS